MEYSFATCCSNLKLLHYLGLMDKLPAKELITRLLNQAGRLHFSWPIKLFAVCLFSVPGPVTVQQGRRELLQRKTRGTALGTQI